MNCYIITELDTGEELAVEESAGKYRIEGADLQMSDRGFLFLFSVLMIAASGAAVAYLLVTGQAGTVDGLFLVITALLIAACFVIYLAYMIRRAMEAEKPAAQPAKAGSASSPAKPAPVQS